MASRTSARTAAARAQAPSPHRQSTRRPNTRRTGTRSASVELGGNDFAPTARPGKRNTRQGSVESIGSNASAASSNQGGRRKRATRSVITSTELSIVAENPEPEQPEGEINEESGHRPRSQSPGSMSQMSGTTAITSASAQTSHTTVELAELDPTMVVEVLPDLWVSSMKLLALLAPSNASVESVKSTVRQLKVPGSAQGKRLRHREQKFLPDREKFGNDDYIRTSFILQKVFGSPEVEVGMPRPDAILHAANIATLIKDLLVTQKESQNTFIFLSNLDTWFPESFVTQFEDNVFFGNSTLLDDTFSMALEVRTQYTIVALLDQKTGGGEWYPDQVLTGAFFDPPAERSEELSYYEDMTTNGNVKNLLRAGPANTKAQDAIIRKRVLELREAFRQSEDAAEIGDLVDFDQLEEDFPWLEFLTEAVQWTSKRLDEIIESIRLQGGVENIVKSLVEAIKNNNSQAELHFEPHPSTTELHQLLPPQNIIPGTSGHNLMSYESIKTLEKMKRNPSAPPSNQSQPRATTSTNASAPFPRQTGESHQRGPSKTRATAASEHVNSQQDSDTFGPIVDDDTGKTEALAGRRTSEYLYTWDAHAHDKNKENQPMSTQAKYQADRRRFVDPQPNARKRRWSTPSNERSEQDTHRPSNGKYARVIDDESDSQDEGFQADQRLPNPNLRVSAPTGSPRARFTPLERPRAQRNGKTAEAARRSEQRTQARSQASARQEGSEEEFEEDDELQNRPRPSASQTCAIAREEVALVRQRTTETQTRKPWSEEDTELLISLIEDRGTSWSTIVGAAKFQPERNQVAVRDKARNLKANFLKSGIPLPINFECIALGKKEVRLVRAVRPNWTEDWK